MNREFLDFVEDIVDAMDKAEILVEGFTYIQRNAAAVQVLQIINRVVKASRFCPF
ncbi:MAG: hypothetical protein PVF47_07640 [Anaerolineae bacterium]|jgi:hypothetical protein